MNGSAKVSKLRTIRAKAAGGNAARPQQVLGCFFLYDIPKSPMLSGFCVVKTRFGTVKRLFGGRDPLQYNRDEPKLRPCLRRRKKETDTDA